MFKSFLNGFKNVFCFTQLAWLGKLFHIIYQAHDVSAIYELLKFLNYSNECYYEYVYIG